MTHRSVSGAMATPGTVAGLFAGIGGLELGLARAGFQTHLLCDKWGPAATTLERRFPGVPRHDDIRTLRTLPTVDVVTAGFPCTDLSQVGRTRGIDGDDSGLVREVFRLIERSDATWVVLENVPNMLSLDRGRAIEHVTRWFDAKGWHWAYRVVDSQFMGVAQRRRRVILVASRTEDPRQVLFADEAGRPAVPGRGLRHDLYGFYWTEGTRGIGWAERTVPTLKGGSKWGIPSPPAVWLRAAAPGAAIVKPSVEVGERLQGFPAGWTSHVPRAGHRWKLVGNAVTVPVATWLGQRLASPRIPADVERRPLRELPRWPNAAACVGGTPEAWALSERPVTRRRVPLKTLLTQHGWEPLSLAATRGFAGRLSASRLRGGGSEFHAALQAHVAAMM